SVVDANWPTQSIPDVFGNVALSVTVPVVVSTALSTNVSVPVSTMPTRPAPGCCDADASDWGVASAPNLAVPVVSADAAFGPAPPGIAVTGRPPLAPYCRIAESCDDGTAKRTRMGRISLMMT